MVKMLVKHAREVIREKEAFEKLKEVEKMKCPICGEQMRYSEDCKHGCKKDESSS